MLKLFQMINVWCPTCKFASNDRTRTVSDTDDVIVRRADDVTTVVDLNAFFF